MEAVTPPKKDPNVEHLKLLTIFYYVLAAIVFLSGFIFFIHIGMGIMFLNPDTFEGAQGAPPAFMGYVFIGVGSFLVVLSWTMGLLLFVCARSIASRRRYLLILIVAGFECLNVPLGTALGIFTFIVLLRPEVKQMFGRT